MLQGQEIFVILLVALVVLGPQRLPEVARKIGQWTAELRRAAGEIRAGLEAEVKEVREVADEFKAPLKEAKEALTDTTRLVDEAAASTRWVGPEPKTGPTPADALEDLAQIEDTGEPAADRPPPRWVGGANPNGAQISQSDEVDAGDGG